MADFAILVVTSENDWLSKFQTQVRPSGASRLVVARSLEKASKLVVLANPRLIAVHWRSAGARIEPMNDLLWANTTRNSVAPVLVIDDEYRAELALALFRMGVDDYLSTSDHDKSIGNVVALLVGRRPAASALSEVDLSRETSPYRIPVPSLHGARVAPA